MTKYISTVNKLYDFGFRQHEIALLIGISQASVSNILNGKYEEE
jgi:predicted transcriptional regulator